MKINNTSSLNSLNQAQLQQDSLLKKLAAAKRITSAADDAAGLQIADRLSSNVNAASQGQRNLYDGIGLAQVYEQSLQGINNDLGELNRLAVAGGNGLYTDADRAALQDEASGYLQNIQNTLQNTTYGGSALFKEGGIQFNTGQSNTSLEVADAGAALSSQDLFNVDLTSAAGAQDAINTIQQATDYVSGLQAGAGASINSFAAQIRNLSSQQVNQEEARSRIEDLDYAKATSDKVAADILSQSSVAVAAQARVQQQQALSLLSN